MNTTYEAEIIVWSRVGHTPITKRGGSYCDELARAKAPVASIDEARRLAKELKHKTPHADQAYFVVQGWPNQNTRSGWL